MCKSFISTWIKLLNSCKMLLTFLKMFQKKEKKCGERQTLILKFAKKYEGMNYTNLLNKNKVFLN